MPYSAYLRGDQFLSLFNEQEAVWERVTERQRHLLRRALEADRTYQRLVAQSPRTTLIEIPFEVLPWETAPCSQPLRRSADLPHLPPPARTAWGWAHASKARTMLPTMVLVVADLEGVRELLGEVLGCYGYAVLTAASAPEAEAIRQRVGPEGLDLVITDLRLTCLPHAQEGMELIQRWHAVTPALPFILISGDLCPHDLRDLPAEGVRCLAKPFETVALLTTVQAVIRREHPGRPG